MGFLSTTWNLKEAIRHIDDTMIDVKMAIRLDTLEDKQIQDRLKTQYSAVGYVKQQLEQLYRDYEIKYRLKKD